MSKVIWAEAIADDGFKWIWYGKGIDDKTMSNELLKFAKYSWIKHMRVWLQS